MRLSTERDRDDARAVEVLHTALESGVTFLDTSDAYCWDDSESGHNERLIARALATWSGDGSRVLVATKGGLTRPRGDWVADGRARHLAAACEASRRALGVDRLHLYQLHAPDPRTPFSTSVRALAALKRDGLVEHIGLCNVTVGQIEQARQIADIHSVQVELSVWHEANISSGVVEYCIANGIRLIAHRPLGGAQRARRTRSDPLLIDLAARHETTPFAIALAWLRDLSDLIVPIPGPTRIEHAALIGRASDIALTTEDRARLDERFPSAGVLRRPQAVLRDQPVLSYDSGEVVLIIGLPAAGKTTVARSFVAQGYERLSRDDKGGLLNTLLPALDRGLESGCSRFVLDNTCISRKSRAPFLQWAAARGVPVRCVWVSTGLEDAQVNAAWRMIAKYGRLLDPGEIRQAVKHDVSAFGPSVLFRYHRELEPPAASEGFSRIETIAFERRYDPSFTNRALIVWCDGVLCRSRSGHRAPRSADDVEVFGERAEVLRRYARDGWQLAALSWQPDIASGSVTAEQLEATFSRLRELLGVPLDIRCCPHEAGPPVCWCRKPLPGLGVLLIDRYRLDPARCIYVGAGAQDPGFARRLGFQYRDASDFFAANTSRPL